MRLPQSIVDLGRWSRTDALVLQDLLGVAFAVQAVLLLVAVLAEAFRVGVRLREDSEGLV